MLSLLRSTIKYQVASSWFFESSVITMMPCPINIRYVSSNFLSYSFCSSYLLVCVVGVATLLGFGIFFPIVFGLYFCSFRLVSNYYYYFFFLLFPFPYCVYHKSFCFFWPAFREDTCRLHYRFLVYIYIPTHCTQLIFFFINNTLKYLYCLKL